MSDYEADSYCSICGAYLEWTDCWQGCQDGYVDEYDEDPINCDPGDMRKCGECNCRGGYLGCPNLPHERDPKTGELI